MTSERLQRQINRLLDEAEEAAGKGEWPRLLELAERALRLDPNNADAKAFLDAANRDSAAAMDTEHRHPTEAPERGARIAPQPTSFVNGRYAVKRFLGEGGKKKVYLAHDTTLDRDVAFALIKTEGLDDTARQRITNETQAMGRLGDHPNIVTVFDVGQVEDGQPYVVLPLMSVGDVERADREGRGAQAFSGAPYGAPSDRPLVGDWDGDGCQSIGVRRDGYWHLNNQVNGSDPEMVFAFGLPADTPISDRWH